jgi:flagellar hook-associated protein FlgK
MGELKRFGEHFAQAVNGHLAIFKIQDPANAAKDFTLDPTFSVAALKPDTNVDPEAISKLSTTCLAIAKMQDESIAGLDGASFGEFLSNSQHKVGSRQNEAQSKAEFFGSLVSELETQQQSVSGVSLDEEMVEVLKNQQVYQAAAKIIQQTSALLQGVIEMV